MKTFTIAVIAGDGVGTEVIPQSKRVLERAAAKHEVTLVFQDFDWGAEHFFRWGRMMPAGAIDLLQSCDGILLGAVGHPEIPDHATLNGLLLPIRRAFDQYANVRPAYLYPGVQSPLAKPKRGDQRLTERFELFARGKEMANAFSELNDPIDQRRRLEAQAALRAAGDQEAVGVDEDYLRAMEYGMPPMGGVGIGIDRLFMYLSGAQTIRDVILFPTMRPE